MSSAEDHFAPPILPWQSGPWGDWLRQLESGRLPHAVLISGLAGLGKHRLAGAFAQAVLCRSEGPDKPCGQCKSCALLQAESHPDLRILEPQQAGKAIRIGQVRDLLDFLAGTAQQGGWKCGIIEPADAMNSHSANALLKSLEEPPGDTLLILVSSMPGRLMATVRSRCRLVPLRPPPREEALAWLKPRVGQGAEELLDYAHGAPCVALNASEAGQLTNRTEILNALLDVAQGRSSAVEGARVLQKPGGTEAVDQVLALVNRIARIRVGQLEAAELNPGQWPDVIARVNSGVLFRYADKLIQAKGLLLSGANPNEQLLWEELMFDWQALTAVRRQAGIAGDGVNAPPQAR